MNNNTEAVKMDEKQKKKLSRKYLGIACFVLLTPLIAEAILCLLFNKNYCEILKSEFYDGFFFMCSISLIAPIIYTLDFVINTRYIKNHRKYPILPSFGLLFFCGIFYSLVKMGKILGVDVVGEAVVALSVITTIASLLIAFQLRMIEMDMEYPEMEDPDKNRNDNEMAIKKEMNEDRVLNETDNAKRKGVEGKLDLDDNEMGDES